jgi:orotidine-5'-phosphate decarboxylase
MTRKELIHRIREKSSFLCVGLDPDLSKIPPHLLDATDPVAEFCCEIVDATRDNCVAYKPNLAFFEQFGAAGWNSLQKTIDHIGHDHFIIADAKRGDIGNTATMYAHAFFRQLNADAVTVAPYMGSDSVIPFLEFPGKWAIVLALTSNKGSADFQRLELKSSGPSQLFEHVLQVSSTWGSPENMMYVVGATHPESFQRVREIVPHHFLLVPGVGAQGGDLEQVARFGMNDDCGLLINSSRQILYASQGKDFAAKARIEAEKVQEQMAKLLELRFK